MTDEALPLTDTLIPADQDELAQLVREDYRDGTPVYPIGGATSLDFGLPARAPGIGLSMNGLKRVVDYPARDMTITVEAGIRMETLSATLGRESQCLPIDLPYADRASLGGVIATNTSGARRYACGTIRDYVIGIKAVDGRGQVFHGGGRVVKNVAGYDFCKLLTGSMGTLGVITQVTLRVKPLPQRSVLVACRVRNWEMAERMLAAMVTSQTAPAAIELLVGPAWRHEVMLGPAATGDVAHLLVGLEGTEEEVDWMTDTLCEEWHKLGARAHVVHDHECPWLWMRLAQFPVEGKAELVIQASLRASRTVEFVRLLTQVDPECSVQAHAGNGVVVARLTTLGGGGLSKTLLGRLQPAAAEQGGHIKVLSCASPAELTRPAAWSAVGDGAALMQEIKRQFDPKNILNRGRFVFGN